MASNSKPAFDVYIVEDRGDDQDAFSRHALIVRELGMWPLPCCGDDGKKLMSTGYNRCASPYSEDTIKEFSRQWPDANLGILTGKSRLVVVDIDSPDMAFRKKMLERFGDTPLITLTGSGNSHLWYKAERGEKAHNLRTTENTPVEIKVAETLVIVPPSVNFETGGPYLFEQGSWEDLERLPLFEGQGLPGSQALHSTAKGNLKSEGERNVALRSYSLLQAPYLRKH